MHPNQSSPSRESIHELFNEISSTYDLVNNILSCGIDKYWRASMVKHIPSDYPLSLLDIATGTGDQLFSFLKKRNNIWQAVGVDLAENMLELAKKKAEKYPFPVSFLCADALTLPFQNGSFDCVTISFGIRNMVSVEKALNEMHRVLKPHGFVSILEFALPKSLIIKTPYLFYLRNILPKIGRLISKNPKAYTYLNETIETFPHGEDFCNLMRAQGFQEVSFKKLTGGIVNLYHGMK